MTFSNMAGLKKRIFSEHYRPKLTKKKKTFPNNGISHGFFHKKKGNGVSNMS